MQCYLTLTSLALQTTYILQPHYNIGTASYKSQQLAYPQGTHNLSQTLTFSHFYGLPARPLPTISYTSCDLGLTLHSGN